MAVGLAASASRGEDDAPYRTGSSRAAGKMRKSAVVALSLPSLEDTASTGDVPTPSASLTSLTASGEADGTERMLAFGSTRWADATRSSEKHASSEEDRSNVTRASGVAKSTRSSVVDASEAAQTTSEADEAVGWTRERGVKDDASLVSSRSLEPAKARSWRGTERRTMDGRRRVQLMARHRRHLKRRGRWSQLKMRRLLVSVRRDHI